MPGAVTAVLSLLDVLGRAVRTETVALPAADLRQELHLVSLHPGLYALRVTASAVTAARWWWALVKSLVQMLASVKSLVQKLNELFPNVASTR